MVAYTITDLEKQLIKCSDKLGLSFTQISYEQYITTLQLCCPNLHLTQELYDLAKHNLKVMEEAFGFKAIRIFYYDTCKNLLLQSYTGKDRLQEKYDCLLRDLKEYHYTLLDDIHLQLDYFIYFRELEKAYKDTYGEIIDYNNRLYSIIKTIRITNYDEKVIQSLQKALSSELKFSGDKYYSHKNLTDKNLLRMLYEHVAEEHFDEEVVKYPNICTGYDGYGNEYWLMDYHQYWSDDTGHHLRVSHPKHTINNYIRMGLP